MIIIPFIRFRFLPNTFFLVMFYCVIFLPPIGLYLGTENWEDGSVYVLVQAVNVAVFAFVHIRTKSESLTLHWGLIEICEGSSTGNTLADFFWLVPVLLYAYIRAIAVTITGLIKGRPFTEEQWIKLVKKMGTGTQYGPMVAKLSSKIEQSPGDAQLYFERGVEYERNGQLEQAVKDFDKAVRLNLRHTEARLRKGRICEEMGDIREAVRTYNELIRYAGPDDQERVDFVREVLKDLEAE